MSAVEAPALGPISWTWAHFDALTARDVYDLLALRNAVFVVEQDCVFLDPDGCDQDAWHLLARTEDGTLVAYLRGLAPGVKYAEPSIGRVVVAGSMRGTGLGRVLMNDGIPRVHALWPGRDVVIGAQQRLETFYRSLGFVTEGDVYDEDGIDHVRMRLPAD
jgi:ElaA protein